MYYQHFGLHGSPFNFTPHLIGYFFSARIADSRWVRKAVLTGAKPNESVVADRRILGEERCSAARAVGATPRVARLRVS
jgi:hypothetical protein